MFVKNFNSTKFILLTLYIYIYIYISFIAILLTLSQVVSNVLCGLMSQNAFRDCEKTFNRHRQSDST